MNNEMTQGIELMFTGMGIVFLFLIMLIGAVKLMAYCVAEFFPEATTTIPQPVARSPQPSANSTPPNTVAAISAAVHQHRTKT